MGWMDGRSRTLSVAYVTGAGVVGNQLRKTGSGNYSHGQRFGFSYHTSNVDAQSEGEGGFSAYRR